MCASIALSIVIIALDGSATFAMTMFTSPGPVTLTIAHHITVLVLSYKEGLQFRNSNPHLLPTMTKRGAVVCIWLLAFMWLFMLAGSCVLIGLGRENGYVGDGFKLSKYWKITLFPFSLEILVIFTITILATLERSALRKAKSSVADGAVELV